MYVADEKTYNTIISKRIHFKWKEAQKCTVCFALITNLSLFSSCLCIVIETSWMIQRCLVYSPRPRQFRWILFLVSSNLTRALHVNNDPPIHTVSQTINACCDGIEWAWHSSIRTLDLWFIAQHVCESLKRLSNKSYGVCCHCLQYHRSSLLVCIKQLRILRFIISITNDGL